MSEDTLALHRHIKIKEEIVDIHSTEKIYIYTSPQNQPRNIICQICHHDDALHRVLCYYCQKEICCCFECANTRTSIGYINIIACNKCYLPQNHSNIFTIEEALSHPTI